VDVEMVKKWNGGLEMQENCQDRKTRGTAEREH